MNRNKLITFGFGLVMLAAALFTIGQARAEGLTTEREEAICTAAANLAGIARAHGVQGLSEAENIEKGHAYVEERVNEEFHAVAKRAIEFGARHKGEPGSAAAEFFALCVQPKT